MSEKHTLYMREWRKKNLEKNRQYYRDYHVRNKKREKELICFNCNAAIGHFQEDIELLKKAIVYMTEKKTYLPLQLLIV